MSAGDFSKHSPTFVSVRTKVRPKETASSILIPPGFKIFGRPAIAPDGSQIAAAVEVSPSTFFRYFPTKEDVVLYDDLDPLFFAAFEAQPPELTPIQAMRGALHLVFAGLSGEEMEQQQVRTELILAVPELRMRMLDQFANLVDLLAELVGKRVGRSANDFKVRAFSGALMGTLLAPILADLQGTLRDYIAQMEDSLDFLEAGLPL